MNTHLRKAGTGDNVDVMWEKESYGYDSHKVTEHL